MIRPTLSDHADLYVSRKTTRKFVLPAIGKKTLILLKTAGLTTVLSALFIGINLATTPIPTADSSTADQATTLYHSQSFMQGMGPSVHDYQSTTLTAPTTPPTDNATIDTTLSDKDKKKKKDKKDDNDDYSNSKNHSYTYTYNTPRYNNYIIPINNPAPINYNQTDLSGLATQINQLETQIVQQMQSCIQIRRQMQSQEASLKQQIQQVDNELQSISRQMNDTFGNDSGQQDARRQLQRQRDQLQDQRNELSSEINHVRNQGSNDRSTCQNTVSKLQMQRRDLENQLNNNFSQALFSMNNTY